MKILLSILALVMIAGCASDKAYEVHMDGYAKYLEIMKDAKPKNEMLVEIVAVDGQPITISAAKFVVYRPTGGADTSLVIQPPAQIKDSEWTSTVKQLFAGATGIGTAMVFGKTASNIVTSLSNSKGATTSTVTSTTTADSHNTDSHNTTTTTTDSHNTTTTDSHNTDSHNTTDNHSVDNHTTNPKVVP